ncbi:HAMP domain-containing methyl-accepting chemotaxis protein [Thiomicrospira microaerophila]|uniref:HAMP domain-containing methyl-accepting chemotaxis protein n=1 Tax=Thiomicrospira microaerophila TaxID=406020 RepID=UPI000698305E|nr:methyl-accepting chemotaxis protein [Thiomicrospira microaerophila]
MEWFNNLKIKNKLIMLVALLIAALTISGIVGYRGLNEWGQNMQNVADVRVPGLVALGALNTERMAIRAQTVSVLQYEGNYAAQSAMNSLMQERQRSWQVVDQYWTVFAALPRQTERGRETFARLQNEYQAWRGIYVDLDRLISQMAQNSSPAQHDRLMREYRETVARMVPISDRMGATFDALTENNIRVTQLSAEEATATALASEMLLAIVLLFSIILSILVSMLTIRAVSRPLKQMTDTLEFIGRNGDFSKRINYQSRDEVGVAATALNTLMASLQQVFKETNDVVGALAKGDFSKRINGQFQGDLGELKSGVNDSAQSIATTMAALSQVMQSLYDGDFSVKLDAQGEGEYKRMMMQASDSMKAMEQAISGINNVMSKLQQGEFNERLHIHLRGELDTLKTRVNSSMESLGAAIEDITDITVALSNGDLTQNITADYPGQLGVLKQAVNRSVESLNETVSIAIGAAEAVSHSALEVAQGSMDLSDRVQQQAAAIEQSSATMEEFSAAVQNNASNAKEESKVEHRVELKAQQAAKVMEQTIVAMSAIQESSHKISEIVSLIDGIAFQTNLLALNAAVEAARAGDHGRGFAVVAGEVRALAQKSAEAAKEISGLINESVARIDQGTKLATESGTAINEIAESIEEVSKMSSQISQASAEQAEGVKQLQDALAQIDQGTQQNAALVEETSAAAESMREQSELLKDRMGFFKTNGAPRLANQAKPKQLAASRPKALPKTGSSGSSQRSTQKNAEEWSEF